MKATSEHFRNRNLCVKAKRPVLQPAISVMLSKRLYSLQRKERWKTVSSSRNNWQGCCVYWPEDLLLLVSFRITLLLLSSLYPLLLLLLLEKIFLLILLLLVLWPREWHILLIIYMHLSHFCPSWYPATQSVLLSLRFRHFFSLLKEVFPYSMRGSEVRGCQTLYKKTSKRDIGDTI